MADCPKASPRKVSRPKLDPFHRQQRDQHALVRWLLRTHCEISDVINAFHQGAFNCALADRTKQVRVELESALSNLEEALFLIPTPYPPDFVTEALRDA
ncbi:hypothetical protein VT84_23485 [Gemmata sp. SH-PL17]|uniref:hypothetical protein n=1 Tax=Gemmata sp. SH-PL17 TaxID=1630693 RepID=UPI00078C9B31|nr:hypothetical protein [Gemmata sp. SH-PL17]AMV27382.1 hypothetical protein VT84_23485 [Gemmata sp. SH-PL17]